MYNIVDDRVPHSLIESTDDYLIPATVDPNYANLDPIQDLKPIIRSRPNLKPIYKNGIRQSMPPDILEPIPQSRVLRGMTPEEIAREDAMTPEERKQHYKSQIEKLNEKHH